MSTETKSDKFCYFTLSTVNEEDSVTVVYVDRMHVFISHLKLKLRRTASFKVCSLYPVNACIV